MRSPTKNIVASNGRCKNLASNGMASFWFNVGWDFLKQVFIFYHIYWSETVYIPYHYSFLAISLYFSYHNAFPLVKLLIIHCFWFISLPYFFPMRDSNISWTFCSHFMAFHCYLPAYQMFNWRNKKN